MCWELLRIVDKCGVASNRAKAPDYAPEKLYGLVAHLIYVNLWKMQQYIDGVVQCQLRGPSNAKVVRKQEVGWSSIATDSL